MVGIVIYYAQYLIAKYLFVSKDGILVNNRYSYVYFKIIMLLIISISSTGGYFMFLHFLSIIMLVGILKAIARIISSAVLNLFYLSCLDKALTVKGWEWLDKGMFVAKVYGAISH